MRKNILVVMLAFAFTSTISMAGDLASSINWKSSAWIEEAHNHIQATEKVMSKIINSPAGLGYMTVMKGNLRNLIAARVDIDFLLTKMKEEGFTSKDEHDLQLIMWNVGFDASAANKKLKAALSRGLRNIDVQQTNELSAKLSELAAVGKSADAYLENN